MKKIVLLGCACYLALNAVALGQMSDSGTSSSTSSESSSSTPAVTPGQTTAIMGVIADHPYCAIVTSESDTQRANGMTDHRKMVMSRCRNSAGVQRTEVLESEGGKDGFEAEGSGGTGIAVSNSDAFPSLLKQRSILIFDRAKSQTITLYPDRKTAVIKTMGRPGAATSGFGGPPERTGQPAMVRPPQQSASHPISRGEDLGDRSMEGIQVHGTLTTTQYPARSLGNANAESGTRELWTNKYYGVIRMSQDNLTGDATTTKAGEQPDYGRVKREMKVQQLKLGEPDPSLFTIPAGYMIRTSNPGSQ